MKILVCTDGSENSKKCIEFASRMVEDCSVGEIGVIHVHESTTFLPDYWQGGYPFSADEKKQLEKIDKRLQEERKQFFIDAEKEFEKHSIPVKTYFKIGHPAEVIAGVAFDENYDVIVIGRRGMGGIKKLFLGSVSSAVLQVAKTNVLIVK